MKNIAILGSTGSIGKNTLRIVSTHPDLFRVKVLAARRNVDTLLAQAQVYHPDLICVFEREYVRELEQKLRRYKIRVVSGTEGLIEAATYGSVNEVIFSMVGAVGLLPIFAAIRAGKSIAVANKEPLVMAGQLLMEEARRHKVSVLPIDSEHSALWQCLEGRRSESVNKLILTSSGGPFRTRKGSFAKITPREALHHPKWKMGPKITIDSATLMNKGLEVIEASNLFGVPTEKIEVLIHPEAIVHAMIELVDGSHLAHLGITDMRLPIQYALSYPERLMNHLPTLDLIHLGGLHFARPDVRRFPCLKLGYEAGREGGTMPSVMNAANEVAVEAFLNRRIGFMEISKVIGHVMAKHAVKKHPDLNEILSADCWARESALKFCR